ncbi:putative transporter slc-17.2 [Dermatophagoides farinae]|uniref:Major facilitator superfamily (MFS) profile domain-containing protein n=1 Tax=Dermatophagoides farinae TaxID=6954 RepID=A0A922IFB6_DERFA|nr:hypothetical protein DERF_001636 [Dermatophagoides farinae]
MRYCQLSSFSHIYLDEYKEPKPSLLCSIRVLIALLSMLGTSIMYITRVNLNIAILAMVQSKDSDPALKTIEMLANSSTNILLNNPPAVINQQMVLEPIPLETHGNGEFEWTPPQQGIILGSFFYGYLSTQVIGGRLAESYIPPDKLIFIALSSSGIINLLTPFLARNSWLLFICSRILLGAFQGVVYPAFYCLFSRWIPSNERSTFVPWLDAGSIMGTILISASSGKIILYFSNFGGWPVVFYFSGALALLWSLLWISFVRSNPEDHPLITKEELSLLSNDKQSQQQDNQSNNISPYWFNILTSPIFLGVLATKICYGVVFDFVSQKIPAYLQGVIGLPVDETGISFSFIMIGYMGTLLSCGAIADYLIKNSSLRTATIRKLFQFTSAMIMIVSLLLISEIGLSKWPNVFLLAALMLGYGFTSGGDLPSVVDISGPLSGTVFALMNTLCSISGFMVPYLVGIVIAPSPTSVNLWRCLFISGAIIMGIGLISFVTFSSANLQTHWFRQKESDEKEALKIPVVQLEYKNSLSLSLVPPSNYIPRYDTFPIGSVDNRYQRSFNI